MESKKESFKALIKEFEGAELPNLIPREKRLPDWCYEITPEGSPTLLPSIAVKIIGPRRSGKTFRLFQIMEQFCGRAVSPLPRYRILYINFEDDRLLPLNRADLDLLLDAFYEAHPKNVDKDVVLLLDEVHQVEGWDLFVRRLLDGRGVRVFMTGSSARIGARPLVEPVPGRAFALKLTPLNFREFLTFRGVPPESDPYVGGLKYEIRFLLEEYLVYGGFPEVVLSDLSAKLKVLRDQFNLVIYKDMVEGFGIRNVSLLKGLVKHLVSHIGSAVSLNAFFHNIPSGLRVSRDTVLEYVSYLEKMDLISLVPVFSESEKVQRVNPRRVFCLDNGFRNAVSFQLAEDEDCLARNLVFQAINTPGRQIFYWKDKGIVDFVTRQDKKMLGITVAYGRELDRAGMDALLALRKAAGRRETDLTVITKDEEKTEDGIKFTPLWKWLLAER
jgi:uncharacterized protein